jgi:protein-tyrosine phosphatase
MPVAGPPARAPGSGARGVIDLHTHLLPGVDDGARTLDEALALCRLAVADGTRVAVVTPHSDRFGAAAGAARLAPDEIERRTAALQDRLTAAGIDLRLVPGMELSFAPDLAAATGKGCPAGPVTLGASRYLLLELPAQGVPLSVPDVVFRLQLAGYVPIIAHPERNAGIAARPEHLYDLVSRGCLAQVTAQSLTGALGKTVLATARQLLRADLVHVIASDAHRLPERPTGLADAVAAAARIVGPARAQAMVTAVPQAVLDGRPITGFTPVVPTTRRRFLPW